MEFEVLMEKSIRLDKYLSNQGIGSRAEVRTYIRRGHVTHKGLVVKDPGYKVLTDDIQVSYNGQLVYYSEYVYLMLNKPKNVVSATSDKQDKTVMDIINHPLKDKLFPVGRLDKDTRGLLLLTNNGQMAHNLLSPKKHVDKTYEAIVSGDISSDTIMLFEEGITLDDGYKTMPALLEILEIFDDYSKVKIIIKEGKFHQIKRMFQALGCEVMELKRTVMGTLVLDEGLKEGHWRALTKEEIHDLEKEV
jgi:16S rRNA pseudouridine516 synthase